MFGYDNNAGGQNDAGWSGSGFGGGDATNHGQSGGRNQFNGNRQPPRKGGIGRIIILFIVGILIILQVVSIIKDPEYYKDRLMMFVVAIVFLIIAIRMASYQLANFIKLGRFNNLGSGVRCPYCGNTGYSVSVQRTRWSKDPSTMSAKERTLEGIGRLFCRLTFGVSDRILRIIPGYHGGAHVRHESVGTCRKCGGTWRMKNGAYW